MTSESSAAEPPTTLPPTDEHALATQRATAACALYCALITKQPSLLRRLFVVFGQTDEAGRAGILKFASSLATTLGGLSPAFLGTLTDLPEVTKFVVL